MTYSNLCVIVVIEQTKDESIITGGERMIVKIDLESEKPIHKQLESAIKYGIITNQLKKGEQLPSVRALASDLGINMHTVNKAYKALEVCELVVKNYKGFKVIDYKKRQSYLQERCYFEENLLEYLVDAELSGITKEEFFKIIDDLYENIKEEGKDNE